MARNEADREDLFAEARALVRKAEWQVPPFPDPILLGERDNGWFTIYVGQDCYYQFDADNRLRRAYLAPFVYRTQGPTLARLSRDRSDHATVLHRTDLEPEELEDFRRQLRSSLQQILTCLQQPGLQPLRVAATSSDSAALDLVKRLQAIAALPDRDWLAPGIRGKR